MVQLSAGIPASLEAAPEEKAAQGSGGLSSVATAALARDLKKPILLFSGIDVWRPSGAVSAMGMQT